MSEGVATVPFACGSCSGSAAAYETIVGSRLQWVVAHECPDGAVQECGWDETPDELRRALLDQCGVYRLRLAGDPGADRLAVLRVLRDSGATVAGLRPALDGLTGAGLTGTETELRLLASRLHTAGAATVLEPAT